MNFTHGIYTIRDRLIDHYLTPIVVTNDKEFLTNVSAAINDPDSKHAIAQAPHHFEAWRLGHVTEDGTLVANREFLGDCNTLVRGSVRPSARPGSAEAPGTVGSGNTPPERTQRHTGAQTGPLPDQTQGLGIQGP